MMSAPKPPERKVVQPTPNFPRKPSSNDIPFENPQLPCAVPHCPNFAGAYCGFCELHCRKMHTLGHTSKTKSDFKKLIEEYSD